MYDFSLIAKNCGEVAEKEAAKRGNDRVAAITANKRKALYFTGVEEVISKTVVFETLN